MTDAQALDELDDDPGPLMAGSELSALNMPMWARARLAPRVGALRGTTPWHVVYWMVLDVSDLPHPHRSALRVLVSRHTNGHDTADMRVRDIAERIPAARSKVVAAFSDLRRWGWVSRLPHPGQANTWALWVPVDEPPNRLRRSPGRARPVPTRDTPPGPTRDTPGPTRDTGCRYTGHHRGQGTGDLQGTRDVHDATRSPRCAARGCDEFVIPPSARCEAHR